MARFVISNGGTLKLSAGIAQLVTGDGSGQVLFANGGSVIDTNGYNATLGADVANYPGHTGSLTKKGAGTLTLTGSNTYTGATSVAAGKLALSGSLTSSITASAGILAPQGVPATTGNLSIPASGTFQVRITGAVVGSQYDQLTVGGSVTLGGALDIVAPSGLAPGTSFTILKKNSTGAISGVFAGKPQGSVFTVSGNSWIISYAGGTGSDIVLTVASQLDVWRWNQFGTSSNSGAAADSFDSDGDGETNFFEFATGQLPDANTSGAGKLVYNGANLEFTYTRSNGSLLDGATFTVEWSDALVANTWSSIGVSESVLTDNGTVQTVRATAPAGSTGKRFIRLRITRP